MKQDKGFTMVELLITIAIIGIIMSIAVPSFDKMLQRNRLKEAIQAFHDDMQFARTRAIKQNQDIFISRIRTSTASGDWCYGLSTAVCDCTTANCTIKNISGTAFNTVQMYSNSGNSSFDFRRGTIGANGVTFTTSDYAARVVFSRAGRVRFCTPPNANGGTLAADRPVGSIALPTNPEC